MVVVGVLDNMLIYGSPGDIASGLVILYREGEGVPTETRKGK